MEAHGNPIRRGVSEPKRIPLPRATVAVLREFLSEHPRVNKPRRAALPAVPFHAAKGY